MKAIAMKHQARAMAGLSTVLQTIQIYNQQGSITGPPRFLCSPGARYQALLTALLLGVSSAWYDASAVSLAHLFGARSLFRAWLVDESLCSVNDEPVLLNRQQSFLVGAFVFLECLASFIHDQTFDALAHIRRFGALAEGQTMYPNPWTGISTPLFVHLAETAVIMRYKRSFAGFQPQARAEAYNEAYKSAERLYKKTLLHTGAGREAMEETKDPTTPLDHLIAMDDAYRLVILMELVQVFPELILDEFKSSSAAKTQALVQETVVDFAIAILTVVSHLPQNSGANVMLPLPLIIAGSALQAPRPFEKRPAGTSASCAARTSISAVMHSPRMLQKWREQTTFRLDRTYKHVGLAPLQFAEQLVQEVWRRADLVDSNGSETAVAAVHWMDTMIEERLETLFG
ncbi:unnamed protein product [Zymoseptoria tritici ST99CH_3D1]|uniref:Transcription factor domain-containing protein n=1 Tax=Zymoseptoria tritici ST99CH_1E4 TaxID=1276532 RepID=A0A2H1GXB9_ZYMTR|nr:unnamed protein product [Zymoseptoria tritici ST99CH_1E4]SMR61201.1 unnamed protein product [Zymoseptoria tritici ST99CH_3D1]